MIFGNRANHTTSMKTKGKRTTTIRAREDRKGFYGALKRNLKLSDAKAAAGLLQNNTSVAIYTGTTCLIFAREIPPDLSLIVVTGSLPVAVEIGRKPRIKTILIGGDYNAPNFTTYGLMAVKQVESFNLDVLFMSVDGLSADNGCTIDQYFEADINETLIRNAKKVVVMVDHSKIGVVKFIKIADLADIDVIITDDKIPETEKEKLQHLNAEMVVV